MISRRSPVSHPAEDNDLSPLIPAAQLMAATSPTVRITDLLGRVAASYATRERFRNSGRGDDGSKAD